MTGQQTQLTQQLKGGRTMLLTSMHPSATAGRALALTTGVAVAATMALVGPAARASEPRSQAFAAVPAPASAHAFAPAAVSAAAPVPGTPDVGSPGTGCAATNTGFSCDLWAASGPVTLPGGSTVTAWTFVGPNDGDPPAPADVTVPVGPTLVFTQGQTVDLHLHNTIAGQQISLSLPQVDGFADDPDGIAAGQDHTYSFTADRPGTFIYEAGGTSDGTRQVAMGLVGALVVLPDPAGTAYGTPASAYTNQAVLVMSDVDPDLNAAPDTYDMRNFSPRYHLFNGLAYPTTPPIPADAGGPALLRVVNAGIVQHAIGVLGTAADVIGISARPLSHPYTVAAENVAAGDTLDAIVAVPTAPGLKYAVLDPSVRLDNDGKASSVTSGNIVAFGGQLTFLQASGTAPDPASAPAVTNLTVAPVRVGPTPPPPPGVTFGALVTDDVEVTGIEYAFDDSSLQPGSPGTTAITTFTPGPSVTLSGVTIDVSGLATGAHRLLVRGQDANGWGPFQSVSFTVDKSGPAVTGLTPATAAVNGASALAFTGSASDVGGGKVVSATWSLDNGPARTLDISPSGGAASVSLSGSVPADTLTALPDGQHTLTATATDDLGNVGPTSSVATFLVDHTAPSVLTVTVTPSPNDGSQGVSYDSTSIEVRATFDDPGTAPSGVASGEGFLTTAGTAGTGFPMVVSTTTSPATLVATVPLSQLTSLPDGNNLIWVRAKDKAGNWGTAASGTLVLNRQTNVTNLAVSPSSTSTAATAALSATATAPAGAKVAAAEYFIGTDPGVGQATAMTVATSAQVSGISASIPLDALHLGALTIGVRARATSGPWGPVATTTLTLAGLFADGFEGNVAAGSALPWASVTNLNGGTAASSVTARITGAKGLLVSATGNSSRAFVTTPTTATVTVFKAQFQVNPNTLVTGTAAGARWATIYRALGSGGGERFRVEFQNNGSVRQVRLAVGTTTSVPIALVSGNSLIRVDYSAGSAPTLTVTPPSGPATAVTFPANVTGNVASAQLGLSQAPTGTGTVSGSLYFDAYNSARYAF